MINNFARITGGADLHCLQLAEGLRARGHDVEFLATADPRNAEHAGEFVPLTVSNATRDQMSGSAARRVAASALWNPSAARAAHTLIARFRPDVAHLHKLYVQLSVAPAVVTAHLGVPLVQTLHDYEFVAAAPTDAGGSRIDRVEPRMQYRLLNTLMYGVRRAVHRPRVSAWIAISRYTARIHAAKGIHASVLPNFTKVLPSGVSLPGFEDRSGVLYLGRLSQEKGLTHVLALAADAPELSVAIAGQGPLRDLVADAADTRHNVAYLGNLTPEAVMVRLQHARLVVMPSLWEEPGGLTALEAMAQGVPIIAYDRGGLAEYVDDAGAGVIIPPTTADLTRTAKELNADPVRWSALSRRGPEAVRSSHTLERYLDRLESIYGEVWAQRRGPKGCSRPGTTSAGLYRRS